MQNVRSFIKSSVALVALSILATSAVAGERPVKGKAVNGFEAVTLEGKKVSLSGLYKKGPTVLVMLRGFPGYQCPACSRQVGSFLQKADEFKGAQVLFVYPGPANGLKKHAAEFEGGLGKSWPSHFQFVLDPDYKVTNALNLRWKAPRETAYPATVVINDKGVATYVDISKSHGCRVNAGVAAKEVSKLK